MIEQILTGFFFGLAAKSETYVKFAFVWLLFKEEVTGNCHLNGKVSKGDAENGSHAPNRGAN